MSPNSFPDSLLVSQQCPHVLLPAGPAWPQGWQLPAGQAVTLRADRARVLSVWRGRVWLTFTGTPGDAGGTDGDVFLQPGDRLLVPRGRSLVMEPFEPGVLDPAVFAWQPALLPCVAPAWGGGGSASLAWRRWWSASAWAA